jgi:hypothetical protein
MLRSCVFLGVAPLFILLPKGENLSLPIREKVRMGAKCPQGLKNNYVRSIS